MNKICTSIEQSKKLIELGIDVNTADMYYQWYSETRSALHVGKGSKKLNTDCPAWSLSALLSLMPTEDKKDEYYVDTESHSDYHTVSYRNCWEGCIHSEYSEESLLDAAFEMVCWLLEKGHIKADKVSERHFAKFKEGLEEASKEYSFNIESTLFQTIPVDLRELWKKEIENAFCSGAKWKEKYGK